MIVLYSLIGMLLYFFYVWFRWSNQKDAGITNMTFKQKIHDERQEFAATFIGAILFMLGGEGLADSVCDFVGFIFNDKAHDLCVSIQVNMEELIYVLGGASFGSILLFAVKYGKRKAKKKLDEL